MVFPGNTSSLDRTRRILGLIDVVSASGIVEGWATYIDRPSACHVQVWLDGVVVAEDMADKFRRDLLRAGIGHGHCAFYAPMTCVAPGKYSLALHDGRTGAPIGQGSAALFEVPARRARVPISVNDVLRVRARWGDEDVRACVDCLQLERNCEAMGPTRFVDRVFRFVLGRWADAAGRHHYAASIACGAMSPNEVFLAVLNSGERRIQDRMLAHPMDPEYPFTVYEYSADLEAVHRDWQRAEGLPAVSPGPDAGWAGGFAGEDGGLFGGNF
jgi:hypothetical protein